MGDDLEYGAQHRDAGGPVARRRATDAPASTRGAGGLSRRDLIRRGAIVGGLVWTAPVLIDSMGSPAGAITGPCDCGAASTYTGGKVDGLGG